MNVSGIGRRTAMALATRDDLHISHIYVHDANKYMGIIAMMKPKWWTLVSTTPVFDTRKLAESDMQKLIENCKELLQSGAIF